MHLPPRKMKFATSDIMPRTGGAVLGRTDDAHVGMIFLYAGMYVSAE